MCHSLSASLFDRPQFSHTFSLCQIRRKSRLILTDKSLGIGYISTMSFNEVLEELPALTVEQRQLVIRRALELDEPPLTPEDEALVQERLAAHHQDPGSGVALDAMKAK